MHYKSSPGLAGKPLYDNFRCNGSSIYMYISMAVVLGCLNRTLSYKLAPYLSIPELQKYTTLLVVRHGRDVIMLIPACYFESIYYTNPLITFDIPIQDVGLFCWLYCISLIFLYVIHICMFCIFSNCCS